MLGSSPSPRPRGMGGSKPSRAVPGLGARRRWSRGCVPGQTLRDRVLPDPSVAPVELPRRSVVGGRRSGPEGRSPRARSWRRESSWDLGWRWSLGRGGCLVSRGDAEGWESSAEELPLRPWAAGDGRGGTSNRLSASRGRRFETSRRSLSGRPERLGPRQPHQCEPLGTLALGASQPAGPSARSLLSLSCAWRPLLHAASPGCEFSFSHSQFPVPRLPLECRTF